MKGVDKSLQKKQTAREDIREQIEEPPLEDYQAKATTEHRPGVENVLRMVEEAVPTSGTVERSSSPVEDQGLSATKDLDTGEPVCEVLVSLVTVRFES